MFGSYPILTEGPRARFWLYYNLATSSDVLVQPLEVFGPCQLAADPFAYPTAGQSVRDFSSALSAVPRSASSATIFEFLVFNDGI